MQKAFEYADRSDRDITGTLTEMRAALQAVDVARVCARCRTRPAVSAIGSSVGARWTAVCRLCADGAGRRSRAASDLSRRRVAMADADRGRRIELFRATVEVRATAQPTERLIGFVARFDDVYRRRDGFDEIVSPGSFERSIRRGDIALCMDHDRRRALACQRDGSLRVRERECGIWIEADLRPADGRTLFAGRGDRPFGASFAFHESLSRIELSQPPRRARILRELDVTELTVITTSRPGAYRRAWLTRDTPQAWGRAAAERLSWVKAAV